jgi:hypothetical protein
VLIDLKVILVVGIDQQSVRVALELPYSDFEDALQMVASMQVGAEYLITRDVVGYRAGPCALQPAELLASLSYSN